MHKSFLLSIQKRHTLFTILQFEYKVTYLSFASLKGDKIGTGGFSYFQGFGSQHHLARMHLTSFWARTLYQQDIDIARPATFSSNTLGLFLGGGDDVPLPPSDTSKPGGPYAKVWK